MRAIGYEAYPGSYRNDSNGRKTNEELDRRKKSEPLNMDSGNGTIVSSKA